MYSTSYSRYNPNLNSNNQLSSTKLPKSNPKLARASRRCMVHNILKTIHNTQYTLRVSKNLKHLRLGHYLYVSDEGLIDAVKGLPELEELEIIICSYSIETVELIGHACPSLKLFSLNDIGSKYFVESCNQDALAIAKSMPNLHKLKLIGNLLNYEGLKAILDGCPHLESLDLRACFRVVIAGDLGKRCGEIKHLRLPNDSTADYSHTACTDSEQNMDMCSPRSSYYDSDDMDF